MTGLISPWLPRVSPAPRTSDVPDPLPPQATQFATRGITWPSIDAALRWLRDQDIVSDAKLEELIVAADAQAGVIAGQTANALNDKLIRELQESLSRGEGRKEWQERAAKIGDWQRSLDETIHRTYTHRAYHEGLDQAIDEFPEVRRQFPYLLYQATHDTRVRDDHLALDGQIAHVDSGLAGTFRERISEWNCRCTLVPMTAQDAIAQGITEDAPQAPPTIPIGTKREPPPIAAAGVPSETEPPSPLPLEFGRSRAQIEPPSNPERRRQWLDSLRQFAAQDLTDEDVASIAGAQDNAVVVINEEDSSIHVESEEYDAYRSIQTDEGELVIHNDVFVVKENARGQGLGLKVFARQVENAIRIGASRIETYAIRGHNWNGYYTWARFGYDGEIPERVRAILPPEYQNANSVLDIVESPGGLQWWKEHGASFDGTFDLRPGSRSMKALVKYINEKGRG